MGFSINRGKLKVTYIVEVCSGSLGIEIDCYGIYEETSEDCSWILGVDLDDYLGI